MAFTKLTLRNWKCHEEKEIEVKSLNRVTGDNGSGKTAVLQALRFLLTGKYEGDPVKNGTAFSEVSGTFSDGTVATRVLRDGKCECQINGEKVTGKAFTEVLEHEFGTSARALDLATKPNMLDGSKEEDLANYILSFLPEKVTPELLKTAGGISDEAVAVYTELFGTGETPITEVPIQVKTMKDTVKELKKTVEKEKAKAEDMPEKVLSKEKLEEQIRRCDEIGKALAIREEKKKAADKVKAERERIAKNIAEKEKAADEIKAEKPAADGDESVKKLLAGLEERLTAVRREISSVEGQIKAAEETLKKLENADVCPLCPKLICKTDKAPLKAQIEGESAVLSRELGLKKSTEEILAEQVKKTRERIDALQKNRLLYTKKEGLLSEIETLNASLKALPEDELKDADIEKLLSDFAGKKKILEELRVNFAKAELARDAKKSLEKDELRLMLLTELTKALSDNGPVIKAIIDKFLKTLAAAATKIAGEFNVKITLTYDGNRVNYLNVFADFGNGPVAYANLSGGEKSIVNVLFQGMLCSLNKSGILVLDEFSILDEGNRKKAESLMTSEFFKKNFAHIFLAGIN